MLLRYKYLNLILPQSTQKKTYLVIHLDKNVFIFFKIKFDFSYVYLYLDIFKWIYFYLGQEISVDGRSDAIERDFRYTPVASWAVKWTRCRRGKKRDNGDARTIISVLRGRTKGRMYYASESNFDFRLKAQRQDAVKTDVLGYSRFSFLKPYSKRYTLTCAAIQGDFFDLRVRDAKFFRSKYVNFN